MLMRRIVLAGLVFLNLFLAGRILFSEQGLASYLELKRKVEESGAQLANLDEKSLDLSQEIRWLKSDRPYLERVIRTEMNYLRENEVLYLFSEDNTQAAAPTDQPGEPQAAQAPQALQAR